MNVKINYPRYVHAFTIENEISFMWVLGSATRAAAAGSKWLIG